MQTNQIRLIDLSVDELKEVLKEVLTNRHHGQEELNPELLTLAEVASYLRISKVTAHKLKKDGKILPIRIGSMLRFDKRVLLNSLQSTKRKRAENGK